MRAHWLTPILNVSDMKQSFTWFEKLGWEKRWEWGTPADFGAVGSGGCEIFLCHDGQGGRGKGTVPRTFGPEGSESADRGVWMSIWVDDVDAVHQHCIEQGLEVTWPPTDMPWNVREMHLRHPDGHVFRVGRGTEEGAENFAQHERDKGPLLEIERVNVPLRLEKRLAALLNDLASHKGMSLDSCLEETLLHTFEQVRGGVASPHTETTLAYIQELKAKHGIEYDCHASYRFVEG